MKKPALILMILFAALKIAQAQTACSVWADVIDTDPDGTNIRSGAGKYFPVLIKMPRAKSIVFISGMKGSWSSITTYGSPYDKTGMDWSDDRGGWISTSLLGLYTKIPISEQFGYLRARPDEDGRVLEKITSVERVPILGCAGNWAKVRYKGKIGWLDLVAQCAAGQNPNGCGQTGN